MYVVYNLMADLDCFRLGSWSPKGKQLVVGKADGTLVQFKPDLKPTRTIAAPGAGFALINLCWLTTTQFAACFLSLSERRLQFHIISLNKDGSPSFLNYDDICYGSENQQNQRYLMNYIVEW